jgi:hypothetical protein
VWLMLDLRKAESVSASEVEYARFWKDNFAQICGRKLIVNEPFPLIDHTLGAVTVQVTRLPKNFKEATAETPFAIHSVLEPRRVNAACGCCRVERRVSRHAALACQACAELGRGSSASPQPPGASPKICAEHAVILEGSLRAFCPAHAPRCQCSALATGFCFGPICKAQGVAHCAEHLQAHPNVADAYFCRACYAELFPPCLGPGCSSLATIRCSHWHPHEQRACAKSYCVEHAKRWQVYGRYDVGLGRCDEHGDLSKLTNPELIFQLAASALVEKRYRLPSLQAVTHVLMKPRRQRYPLTEVAQMFQDVRGRLDAANPFENRMIDLIRSHEVKRREDLQRDAEDKAEGQQYFDGLVAKLRHEGFAELADNVRFADYRPVDTCLYIRLEGERLRGQLIGTGGEHIRGLSQAIGVRISFERDAR